jgi:hypothetical protein
MMKVYKSDLPGKYSDYLELEWAYLRIFLILASNIYSGSPYMSPIIEPAITCSSVREY